MPRKPRPYLMPGRPQRTKPAKTIADPPDRRVPEVSKPPLTAAQLRKLPRDTIDPRLRSTDRWLERWTITPGSGPKEPALAAPRFQPGSPESTATALNDRESYMVDIAVRTAPVWARTFVQLWYRSDRTVPEIAVALRMKRRQSVYEEREFVLAYFLGRLAQMGFEMNTHEPDEDPAHVTQA